MCKYSIEIDGRPGDAAAGDREGLIEVAGFHWGVDLSQEDGAGLWRKPMFQACG